MTAAELAIATLRDWFANDRHHAPDEAARIEAELEQPFAKHQGELLLPIAEAFHDRQH